jgi:hypothetical protein
MCAETAWDYVSALPDEGTGLDDARHARGWISSPDVLQRIAVQHDHIRMSIGRKGLELVLGAAAPPPRALPRSSASVPRGSRPLTRAGPRSCSS